MPPTREELFELYRVALDEYRFVVQVGWSRTQQALVINVAILTAGFGLLQVRLPGLPGRLLVVVFLVGSATALLGVLLVRMGHQYYREAQLKKTLLEDLLGLWAPLKGYPPAVGTLAVARLPGRRPARTSWRIQPLIGPGR